MLLPRVITALVLLAILLPALFAASPLPFVLCAWVLLSLGAWEWSRLSGVAGPGAWLYAAAFSAASMALYAAGYTHGGSPFWAASWTLLVSAWVLLGAWALRAGVPGWAAAKPAVRLALGLLVLLGAWVAVVQARSLGVNFLLSAMALVWAADVGAYATGKTLSKRWPTKLAPAISPGKTWVGAIGGTVWAVLVAWLWLSLERHYGAGGSWGSPSLPQRLQAGGAWLLVLAVVFYVALAILGDLVESLMKRATGYKDSSQLLPGHGGVLDRLDALLPTLPLAMMFVGLLERVAQ
jgi:phosphatidate cytidylyltransferase